VIQGRDDTRRKRSPPFEERSQGASCVLSLTGDVAARFEAVSDEHVVKLLNLISRVRIDTLITIWQYDAHPAHQATNAICMAASRKIPNVLTVRLSWNSVRQAWKPSRFVDISRTLEDRVKALQCYADEWARTGHLWERYMRSTAALYGLEAGCDAAEGFEVVKVRL
jgi:LmbE family N-acetylglucosaminyl deacetylase